MLAFHGFRSQRQTAWAVIPGGVKDLNPKPLQRPTRWRGQVLKPVLCVRRENCSSWGNIQRVWRGSYYTLV
jgi:hypothetical protein